MYTPWRCRATQRRQAGRAACRWGCTSTRRSRGTRPRCSPWATPSGASSPPPIPLLLASSSSTERKYGQPTLIRRLPCCLTTPVHDPAREQHGTGSNTRWWRHHSCVLAPGMGGARGRTGSARERCMRRPTWGRRTSTWGTCTSTAPACRRCALPAWSLTAFWPDCIALLSSPRTRLAPHQAVQRGAGRRQAAVQMPS